MTSQKHDVVLYGATGFTGRQAVRYFAEHAPAGLRWAIAGRNRNALEGLQRSTNAPAVIVADSTDPASIDAMVSSARVLLTTAGPFTRYSPPVVDACIRHRVDYVDITGETLWVRGLIDRYHATAARDGVRIVPFCGFDSVPSDLGTLLVVTRIRERWGQPTRRVSASFRLRGGINGGSIETALLMAEKDVYGAGDDVLLLNPPEHSDDAERARSADFHGIRYDTDRKVWLSRFFMESINTRVVRRSNALLEAEGEGYGPEFSYEEALEHRSKAAARASDLGQRAFDWPLRLRAGRALVRAVAPKPGAGPSEKTLEHGFMRVRLLGESADGRKLSATLEAKGDPGNRVTVLILCEAALALATQRDSLPGGPKRGGILTPATALGLPLLERLQAAGLEVSLEPSEGRDQPLVSSGRSSVSDGS